MERTEDVCRSVSRITSWAGNSYIYFCAVLVRIFCTWKSNSKIKQETNIWQLSLLYYEHLSLRSKNLKSFVTDSKYYDGFSSCIVVSVLVTRSFSVTVSKHSEDHVNVMDHIIFLLAQIFWCAVKQMHCLRTLILLWCLQSISLLKFFSL